MEVIFRKERIVIPRSLTDRFLNELYADHFGCVKMKKLNSLE